MSKKEVKAAVKHLKILFPALEIVGMPAWRGAVDDPKAHVIRITDSQGVGVFISLYDGRPEDTLIDHYIKSE